MSFLAINGVELRVAVDSFSEKPREIGEHDTSFNGTGVVSRQGTKRDCAFETVLFTPTEGRAWDKLLRGEGHVWSFDSSFYSSKGLGPNAGYVATILAGSAKFGASQLSLTATTGTITFATQLGSTWSLMFWRYESGAWHHYIICSDTTEYYDGAAGAYATTWIAVSGGSVTITNATGSAVLYDDLVVLPFVVPATWAAIWGVAATAFPSLPSLSAAGDFDPEARTVKGMVSSGKLQPAVISGVLYAAVRKLSVELQEV